MTVIELCELFVSDSCQEIHIWCDEYNAVIWKGYADSVPEALQMEEISSIDNVCEGNNGIITINIFGDELELLSNTVYDAEGREWIISAPENIVDEITRKADKLETVLNWGEFDESENYYADDGCKYDVCINQNRVTLWEEEL